MVFRVKNPTWRRINSYRSFIPPGWGCRIEQLGQERKKKNTKIGCFAKGDAAVTDLRVIEQGQSLRSEQREEKREFFWVYLQQKSKQL